MEYPSLAQGANLSSVRLKNDRGEEIGTVKEWMMDVDEGKVAYVLADLNHSKKLTAIPWERMKADKQNGGYKLACSPEDLQNAMEIDRDQVQNLVGDKEFLDKVYDNFNCKKYWDSSLERGQSQRQNLDVSKDRGYQ